MDLIICPHCKKQVKLSEAIIRQLQQGVRTEEEEKGKIELEKAREKIEIEAMYKAKKETELELKDAKNEAEEYKKQQDELRKKVLEANEQTRLIKLKDEEREIENQKWKMLERDKMSDEITKREQEKAELDKRELLIQLDSMKKAAEEVSKKGGSKSQQVQGEALEQVVFNLLTKSFPLDNIVEIEKGVLGADIRQIVKSPKGYPCGSILWECKRTKWDEKKFIEKLKADQRAESANLAVIVSTNLPKDALDGFINRGDDIWICALSLVAPVAVALRKILLDATFQRALAVNRGEKKEDLFSYITSTGFIQPVKTIVEVYKEITSQITKERGAYEKIWKQRESQAQRIINSMASIVGNIQGKIGASALQIKELDLIESGD
jgi:hypothetical protein